MINLTKDILALSFVESIGCRDIMELLKDVPDSSDSLEGFFDEALLRKAKSSKGYQEELQYIEKNNIEVLTIKDDAYPDELKNIYDPPSVLFYKGDLKVLSRPMVAVVGSRKCTTYGKDMACKISGELAKKGITITSGMARGIDSSAHTGAIESGGGTLAVMGTGFQHIYPKENFDLFNRIIDKGLVVTEYNKNMKPTKWSFPRRNRIISGLSRGVVVVEAARKSGAMITVDFALEQGREVFAVPGRADAVTSEGANFLIGSGARLVTSARDVIEELNLEVKRPVKA